MLSIRPYLLEAFYQWVVDSRCTPILLVDASHPQCRIPQEFLEDGEAVFNISPHAVRDLKISKDSGISFKASFSGVIHVIAVPLACVLALYAEENGDGYFPEEENTLFSSATASLAPMSQADVEVNLVKKNKPFLTLVE